MLWINGILGDLKVHAYRVLEYSAFGFGEISTDNFSGNFFQMIVHPAIYLALVSWILQLLELTTIIYDLWLLIPAYWLLRIVFALLSDTFAFTNWIIQLVALFFSLLIGEGTLFCIIFPLVNKDESIFISATAFRDAFWYAVLVFFAKIIWDTVKNNLVGKVLFPSDKKVDVIIRRYKRYKKKYHEYIQYILNKECVFKSNKQRDHFECLLFAIMIYEIHNRPLWARMLEYCIKLICPNRTMSLGVMQVQSNELISNRMSIALAIEKLYAVFSTSDNELKLINSILDYNSSDRYCEQVGAIYEELCQFLDLGKLGHQRVEVHQCSFVKNK